MKYKFTGETQSFHVGNLLHRIQACESFGDVVKGDLGGWIESEANLSHEGTCWVGDDARVLEDARVLHNARVLDDALVRGAAQVRGEAQVRDEARLFEKAWVNDRAQIFGYAEVDDHVMVFGYAQVYDLARVSEDARVSGRAKIYEEARVNSHVIVQENAIVAGDAWVSGEANLAYEAHITNTDDYFVAGPIGSRNAFTTIYVAQDGIRVSCGCFYGTLREFEEKVNRIYADTFHAAEYRALIEMARIKFYFPKNE